MSVAIFFFYHKRIASPHLSVCSCSVHIILLFTSSSSSSVSIVFRWINLTLLYLFVCLFAWFLWPQSHKVQMNENQTAPNRHICNLSKIPHSVVFAFIYWDQHICTEFAIIIYVHRSEFRIQLCANRTIRISGSRKSERNREIEQQLQNEPIHFSESVKCPFLVFPLHCIEFSFAIKRHSGCFRIVNMAMLMYNIHAAHTHTHIYAYICLDASFWFTIAHAYMDNMWLCVWVFVRIDTDAVHASLAFHKIQNRFNDNQVFTNGYNNKSVRCRQYQFIIIQQSLKKTYWLKHFSNEKLRRLKI